MRADIDTGIDVKPVILPSGWLSGLFPVGYDPSLVDDIESVMFSTW